MNLHGPQSDRDQLWITGKPVKPEGIPGQNNDSDLGRLRDENTMLRNQVQRAMKELKAYQIKYPSPFSVEPADNDDQLWSSSPEISAPLFKAYDFRIAEQENTIQNLNSAIEKIQQNLEVVIQENDELRSAQLDRLKERSAASTNLDPNAPINSEIIAELTEQLDVLKGENNLLMEQRTVLMSELDNHQAELEKKVQDVANCTQQISELSQNCAAAVARAQRAETDRDEAAKQALGCSDALGKLEIALESVTEQLDIMKQKCKESDALVAEYRRQLRATSERSDGDSASAVQRVQAAEARVRELQSLLHGKVQELDVATELNRKLRSEYQSTRQDAEGMLQVMGGLERQLNEYAAREAEVERLAKDSRERIEESLTIKEQCNARDEQNKREIDRLVNERKLSALRRKDELEKAIDQSKRVMDEHASTFEKEMEDLAEKNAKLMFEAEKAVRDSRSAKELLERQQRLHEEEQKSTQATLRELTERLQVAVLGQEQEAAKRVDAQEQCKDSRISCDKLRAQLEESRARQSQAERSHEAQHSADKASIRELQKELAEKVRQLSRKCKELEDVRSSLQAQLSALERRRQDEGALYQRRAAEAERSAKDLEAAGFAGDLRVQGSIEQLKEKYAATVALLEAKLRTEVDAVKTLTMKIRNSEAVISDLLEEKAGVSRLVEESQDALKQQEEELLSCKHTIADLTNQLSSSHSAREEGAHRAARAIEELSNSPVRGTGGYGYYSEQKERGGGEGGRGGGGNFSPAASPAGARRGAPLSLDPRRSADSLGSAAHGGFGH